jgi:hypothetical protein
MSLVKYLLSIRGGVVFRVVPFNQEKSPKAKGALAGSFSAKDPFDGAGLTTVESGLVTVESWP